MREKYWSLYERVTYQERYYWYYRQSSIFRDRIVKVILIIGSISGFSSLPFWDEISAIWAVVVLAIQVLSACAYLLPYSDQITSINYLAPELQHLLNRVDHDWDTLPSLTPAEINKLVLKYNTELADLENKYTQGISFPVRTRVQKKALADCEKYNFSQFGITQVDNCEEVTKNGN